MINTSHKTRSFAIFIIFVLIYIIIIVNLYLIQIRNADYYEDLAKKQYNITVITYPQRALILDANKNPLTLNKESLSAFILPNKIQNMPKLKIFLKKNFPKAFNSLNQYTDKYFMYIKRKLSDNELKLLEQSNINDIKILKESGRFYPVEAAGTITGITDIDNNGLFGIEKEFNTQLAGSPTTLTLEKDARSGQFYFTKETTVKGKTGVPVLLTIDRDLQFLIHEELKEAIEKFQAKEGAAIVMDPTTGNIIAMVSIPDFDPNDTKNVDLQLTKNNTIACAYELGSVMKVFVTLAALEENLVTPDELIDCENTKQTKIDGMSFTTWAPHGIIPFCQVVEKSNNIGMVKVAKRLGPKLYNHYIKMGFGKKTGIPLGGEQKGFVSPPNKWSKRSIISLSFGYEITATLLQLARAFSIIANNGLEVTPKLIAGTPDIINPKRIYSQKAIDELKLILQNTVTQGTAHKAEIKGYTIMGKTGTANLAIDGTYSKSKNIYTFTGIVEKNGYKRVIATYIKESPQKDLYASSVTAPLFEQIAQKILIHDKII